MQKSVRRKCVIAIAILLMAACARPPSLPPATPAEFPTVYYRQLEAAGKPVLRIDSRRSLIAIEVGRAGPLARMGHDHVVAAREIEGLVAVEEGRADLVIPLERLTVDEPALRREAGFDTQPDQEAIEGTRGNMLQKVLEAQRHPDVRISVTRVDAGTVRLFMTLHGATRVIDVPVRIEALADGIAVSGRFAFLQSDFGIVPYAIFGGALQVRDRVDLRFRLVAAKNAG
jgi:hypothetical protein